jgi:3-phosphoshikimate 1-carboxyvinyltransferase
VHAAPLMSALPFLDLPPLRRAAGTVRLPGSKSISNRALLLAGLAAGRTTLRGVLHSDDTRVMLSALRTLGCGVLAADDGALHVTGLGGRLPVPEASLHLGNAGTAMRPLAAALAVLAARQGGRFELSGVPRMHERPIGDLVDALRQLGCAVHYLGREGYPPLCIEGTGGAALHTDTPVRVRGDVSSQFLTALLLALPLASDERAITLEVDGELISKPYVEITLALLARFGIAVERDGWRRFTIAHGSAYRTPGEYLVEGDASSASYFVALGAIAATDAPLRIEGVGSDSIQGDIGFLDAARAMGAQVHAGPGFIEARRGRWPLRAIRLDCNAIPDAAMTLAAMALYADGTTRLDNIASWRVKETDRIAAMSTELRKLGAHVVAGADFIEIDPPARWQPAALATYDDHRMAMCGSLAAFGGVPVRILDPGCVAKTYPHYFDALLSVAEAAPADVPVLAVDGPSASGKGTLAYALAQRLGYHFLDSGSLYRVCALAVLRAGIPAHDGAAVAEVARGMRLRFAGEQLFLDGEDVTQQLRREDVGSLASQVSALPAVRAALHGLQLAFRRAPGLVADGRDMGTVVFPDARLKVFLTASAAERAQRRYKQLISKGISANIDSLRADLEARDARDTSRPIAPLKAAEDAVALDNSALTVEQSVDRVLEWWAQRSPFGGSPAAAQAAPAADS